MSIRTERVASVIQQALSRPLGKLASEISAGLITVTSVRMSPDLRIAKVYLSIFGGQLAPEKVLARIEEHAKHIRHEVASTVQLRYAPELRFYLDDTLDNMDRINSLLKKVREEYPSHPDSGEPDSEPKEPDNEPKE